MNRFTAVLAATLCASQSFAGDSHVQLLSGGVAHTCAVGVNGSDALCWGSNGSGQLGTGGADRSVPTGVPNLPASPLITSVSVGFAHSCAVVNGGVICWGASQYGQAGAAGWTPLSPTFVAGLESGAGVKQVAAGQFFSCAITQDDTVQCWGSNSQGQLGIGTIDNVAHPSPSSVVGLANVKRIALGASHACALTYDGEGYCWGDRSYGQIGDGGFGEDRPLPTHFSASMGSLNFLVAGQYFTCAASVGAPRCWGKNDQGQIGTGAMSLAPIATPTYVTAGQVSIGSLVDLTAGADHVCAANAAGQTICWGSNTYGQLGNGQVTHSAVPVLSTMTGVTSIAAGARHTCAENPQGIQCWGLSSSGQLGNGELSSQWVLPTAIVQNLNFDASVAMAGGKHTCVLGQFHLACWGNNRSGQTAGSPLDSDKASPSLTLSPIMMASAGEDHTCAIKEGNAICWGSNASRQLGVAGSVERSDVALTVAKEWPEGTVSWIAAGVGHSCAVGNGAAYCWGENGKGQLGNNTLEDSPVPVSVVGGLGIGVEAIVAGANHSCAISSNGAPLKQVRCWGARDFGQLGDGAFSALSLTFPHTVITNANAQTPLENVVALSTGLGSHSCALTANGSVYCWGKNDLGQLGNGTSQHAAIATKVNGIIAASISVGAAHTCAVGTDGALLCWGDNSDGQLGSGRGPSKLQPTPVPGFQSAVTYVATGKSHTCAVRAGVTYCWGDGLFGKLGNGQLGYSAVPVGLVQPLLKDGFESQAN